MLINGIQFIDFAGYLKGSLGTLKTTTVPIEVWILGASPPGDFDPYNDEHLQRAGDAIQSILRLGDIRQCGGLKFLREAYKMYSAPPSTLPALSDDELWNTISEVGIIIFPEWKHANDIFIIELHAPWIVEFTAIGIKVIQGKLIDYGFDLSISYFPKEYWYY